MTYSQVALLCALVLFLTLAVADARPNGKHRDCHGYWKAGERGAGVYTIYPNGTDPVKILCNHTATGTWQVIQRRVDGKQSFYQNWQAYKRGFGSVQGDYWAGLDVIHHLTNTGSTHLRIDMADWYGQTRVASYSHFVVLDESNYYRLIIDGFSGNVVDDMAHQNGMYFYTPDRYDQNHCAVNMRCGWWFNYCAYTLPNGHYYPNGPYKPGAYYDGIYWKDWLGFGYSLKFFSMSLFKQ